MRSGIRIGTFALAALVVPAAAFAQGVVSPTTPAHPTMPWGSGISTPQGQLIRYIYYHAQTVTLEYTVPAAAVAPSPAEEPAPPPAAVPDAPASPPADASAAAPAGGEVKTAESTPPAEKAPDAPPAEAAPPASSEPEQPQVVRQQVVVPGYTVRETTVGFFFPERWVIEQLGPNQYRWRQLPAQLVPRQ